MMDFPKLSLARRHRVEKWMATDEFRSRVEAARQRFHAGEALNFPALATELDLPLEIVLSIFSKTAADHGVHIVPIGRPN